jgi:hypothetical protein
MLHLAEGEWGCDTSLVELFHRGAATDDIVPPATVKTLELWMLQAVGY